MNPIALCQSLFGGWISLWRPNAAVQKYNELRQTVAMRDVETISREWSEFGISFETARETLDTIATENGFNRPWFSPLDKLSQIICDDANEFATVETLLALGIHDHIDRRVVQELNLIVTIGELVAFLLADRPRR